jgi:hypothetical protein
MNVNLAEKFVNDQIPMKIRRLFPPKLKAAYVAADEHIRATPMLQIPSASGHRGRVISLAVDFAVKGLIDSQEWPVDYRWEFFAKPTGQYLEVVLPHSTLSISQVSYWNEQPRDVVFRANARLGNRQIELPGFETEDNTGADDVPSGRISCLLVHGHRDIEFAHIGIPHQYHSRGYIYQSPNLMRLLYEVSPPDVPPPENEVDLNELLSLKEDIERAQRDNGES